MEWKGDKMTTNFNIRRDTWNTTGPKAISCASLCASAAVHCSFVYLLCIIPDLFLCPERVVIEPLFRILPDNLFQRLCILLQ